MINDITVALLTHNNDASIERALESTLKFSNVIVIDSGSNDNTLNICEKYKVRVLFNKFNSFKDQRNFALTKINTEFVLFLDSDEKITDDLLKFLIGDFKNNLAHDDYNIFEIFRTEFYNGKEIVYGFGRSNYQSRLLRVKKVAYHGDVHEYPVDLEGKASFKFDTNLRLDHYPYRNLDSIMNRLVPYAKLASIKKISNGKKIGFWLILLNLNWQILRLAWLGRKDGYAGVIAAFAEGISRAITYIYVYDANKRKLVD